MGISAFCEYTVLPEIAVAKITKDAPLVKASVMGYAVPTGMGAVRNAAKVEMGSTVAVFGLGAIGMAVIQGAVMAGASRIIGIDTNPAKFLLARNLGATDLVNPTDHTDPIHKVIVEMTGGGVDYSFEAIGRVDVMRATLECCHKGWGECTVMLRPNPRGGFPVVSESAFVDPTAILCCHVIVEDDVFIGSYAVIRADEADENGHVEPIRIGSGSNIQDGVVIHSKDGAAVTIGSLTSIAHRSIIYGPCTVGDEVFIGFNSVTFNCTVERGCVVRHNSVVEDCVLPAEFYLPSTTTIHSNTDMLTIPQVTQDATAFSESVAEMNVSLGRSYRRIANQL